MRERPHTLRARAMAAVTSAIPTIVLMFPLNPTSSTLFDMARLLWLRRCDAGPRCDGARPSYLPVRRAATQAAHRKPRENRLLPRRAADARRSRSEERRVGKEWRSRWAPYQ